MDTVPHLPTTTSVFKGVNQEPLKRLFFYFVLSTMVVLYSCSTHKNEFGIRNLSSQKLESIQVLNKKSDQIVEKNETPVKKNKSINCNILRKNRNPAINRIAYCNGRELRKYQHFKPKSIIEFVNKKTILFFKTYSPIAENVDPDMNKKNPYMGPLLWSLGVALLWAINWITLINTIDLFGGFGLLFVPVLTFPMIILCLILNLITAGKQNFTEDRIVSSTIAWFYALITFLVSLTTAIDFPSFFTVLLSLLLLTMMIVYFVKWINAIQEFKSEKPPNTREQKKHNIIQALLCLCCLGTLYMIGYSLGFPWFTPWLLALFIIVCTGFFLLWLYRLKPKPRETIFFIGFLLAGLIGLFSLPAFSYPGPITWLISFIIAAGFLFLWIKNLKYWRKANPSQ